MEKTKITPEVVMRDTVVGQHITKKLVDYAMSIILLIITSIVINWLSTKHLFSTWLETFFCVELTYFALVLLAKCKSIVQEYYDFVHVIQRHLIVEKRTISTIITAPFEDSKTFGMLIFKNQDPLNCYMISIGTNDFQGATEAYMIDVDNGINRVGIGALSVDKYTL